jgi:hypothetical protein
VILPYFEIFNKVNSQYHFNYDSELSYHPHFHSDEVTSAHALSGGFKDHTDGSTEGIRTPEFDHHKSISNAEVESYCEPTKLDNSINENHPTRDSDGLQEPRSQSIFQNWFDDELHEAKLPTLPFTPLTTLPADSSDCVKPASKSNDLGQANDLMRQNSMDKEKERETPSNMQKSLTIQQSQTWSRTCSFPNAIKLKKNAISGVNCKLDKIHCQEGLSVTMKDTESNWSKKLRSQMGKSGRAYRKANWNAKTRLFLEQDAEYMKSVSMSSQGTIAQEMHDLVDNLIGHSPEPKLSPDVRRPSLRGHHLSGEPME